jgi:hypothetical protein
MLGAGVFVNMAIALSAALFVNSPPLSTPRARERAVQLLMREPNPTKPIWPQRVDRGWFTTFQTRHPESARPNRTPDPYIEVHLSVGFPLRFLRSQSDYRAGGWRQRVGTVNLMARPDKRGAMLMRELPLGVNVGALALNSMLYAA